MNVVDVYMSLASISVHADQQFHISRKQALTVLMCHQLVSILPYSLFVLFLALIVIVIFVLLFVECVAVVFP